MQQSPCGVWANPRWRGRYPSSPHAERVRPRIVVATTLGQFGRSVPGSGAGSPRWCAVSTGSGSASTAARSSRCPRTRSPRQCLLVRRASEMSGSCLWKVKRSTAARSSGPNSPLGCGGVLTLWGKVGLSTRPPHPLCSGGILPVGLRNQTRDIGAVASGRCSVSGNAS